MRPGAALGGCGGAGCGGFALCAGWKVWRFGEVSLGCEPEAFEASLWMEAKFGQTL